MNGMVRHGLAHGQSGGLAVVPTPPVVRDLAGGVRLIPSGFDQAFVHTRDGTLYAVTSDQRKLETKRMGSGELLGAYDAITLVSPTNEVHFVTQSEVLPPLQLEDRPLCASGAAHRVALVFTRSWDLRLYRLRKSGWTPGTTLFTGEEFLCRLSVLQPDKEWFLMAGANGLFVCKASAKGGRRVRRFPFHTVLHDDPVRIHRLDRHWLFVESTEGLHVFQQIDSGNLLTLEATTTMRRRIAWATKLQDQFLLQAADQNGTLLPSFFLYRPGESSPREGEGMAVAQGVHDAVLYVCDPEDACVRCVSVHRVMDHPDEHLWQVDLPNAESPPLAMAVVHGVLLLLYPECMVTIGERTQS